MTAFPTRPDARALAAEAENLRAGFAELAAEIAARVRQDRALTAHLDGLRRQSAALDGAAIRGGRPGPAR